MAYDINTAKQAAQKFGVQPPAGADYDTWVMQWFENALNAGDPRIVQMAGGGSGAGYGAGQAEENTGGIADWQNAAPASEWLGKRNPTPRELRRYAHDRGQSEDFKRYDDRQLAAWISGHWNAGQGGFEGGVEKPTEKGGSLDPARLGGGGRGGGGGGGKGVSTGPARLYSPLADMLANQGGFLSQYDPTRGDEKPGLQGGIVKGGGIWYQPTQTPASTLGLPSSGMQVGGNMAEQPPTTTVTRPGFPSSGIAPHGNMANPPALVPGSPRSTPGISPGSQIGTGLWTGQPLVPGQPGGTPGFTTNSLTGVIAPLQTAGGANLPKTDALTGMMSKYQAKKRIGSWF